MILSLTQSLVAQAQSELDCDVRPSFYSPTQTE